MWPGTAFHFSNKYKHMEDGGPPSGKEEAAPEEILVASVIGSTVIALKEAGQGLTMEAVCGALMRRALATEGLEASVSYTAWRRLADPRGS